MNPLNTAQSLARLQPGSQSSMQPLQQRKEQFEKKKNANSLVKPMLMTYPDYGKSTEHYQAGIIGVFAEYPEDVQQRLAHPITGIRGRCAYLPTIADVVKMADEFLAHDNHKRELDRRYGGRRVAEPVKQTTFNPYPKLTEAFADQPELLKDKTFNELTAASRALAMFGKAEVERCLNIGAGKPPHDR